jgi:hypothetical protein
MLSGNRTATLNLTSSNPKKQSALNQTINKFTAKSKSIGVAETKNPT